MRPSLLPAIALGAVLALAACNSLSSENEGQLSLYLENAAGYYEAGQYERAIQQWQQALVIDSGNDQARLGQAMAYLQKGRFESPDSVGFLVEAEKRLEVLRHEDLEEGQWKAELGFALAQERWCELYDRKLRRLELDAEAGKQPDPATIATAKREFESHLVAAARSFQSVLSGEEKEARDKLTCWLGLARVAAWRDDLPKSLEYARLYETQILRSKKLWTDAIEKYPRETAIYQAKLSGAEMQEGELRDLMGICYFKLGNLDKAEEELTKVITLFPERAPAYLNRGIVRETRGDLDLARGDYKRFLVLTDLPETDPSIVEAERRMAGVKAKLESEAGER